MLGWQFQCLLAIHPIRHTSMPRNAVPEVLDIKCTFEAGGKEPSKGRHETREEAHCNQVELVRHVRDRRHRPAEQSRKSDAQGRPDRPLAPDEDVTRCARHLRERVLAEIVDRADHVVESHEECAPDKPEDDRGEKCTDKPFHGLLGRELDEWCTAKRDSCKVTVRLRGGTRTKKGLAPDVCKDVIANDQRSGNPEPNETLKNIVDDEMAT